VVEFHLPGLPPYKDLRFSIRNPRHHHYKRFRDLRAKATYAMAGRAWSHGAVELEVEVHAPTLEGGRTMVDYIAGILDTLDGSHGTEFTYLPIAFNDDAQVSKTDARFFAEEHEYYLVRLRFLEAPTMEER
jgi:hypothetical protein